MSTGRSWRNSWSGPVRSSPGGEIHHHPPLYPQWLSAISPGIPQRYPQPTLTVRASPLSLTTHGSPGWRAAVTPGKGAFDPPGAKVLAGSPHAPGGSSSQSAHQPRHSRQHHRPFISACHLGFGQAPPATPFPARSRLSPVPAGPHLCSQLRPGPTYHPRFGPGPTYHSGVSPKCLLCRLYRVHRGDECPPAAGSGLCFIRRRGSQHRGQVGRGEQDADRRRGFDPGHRGQGPPHADPAGRCRTVGQECRYVVAWSRYAASD